MSEYNMSRNAQAGQMHKSKESRNLVNSQVAVGNDVAYYFTVEGGLRTISERKKCKQILQYITQLEEGIQSYNASINQEFKRSADLSFNFAKLFDLSLLTPASINQKMLDQGIIWNLQGASQIRTDYQLKIQEEMIVLEIEENKNWIAKDKNVNKSKIIEKGSKKGKKKIKSKRNYDHLYNKEFKVSSEEQGEEEQSIENQEDFQNEKIASKIDLNVQKIGYSPEKSQKDQELKYQTNLRQRILEKEPSVIGTLKQQKKKIKIFLSNSYSSTFSYEIVEEPAESSIREENEEYEDEDEDEEFNSSERSIEKQVHGKRSPGQEIRYLKKQVKETARNQFATKITH